MKLDENNYVDLAEAAIKRLSSKVDQRGREIPMVTTSKIRNLLAMTADIYNDVLEEKEERLSPEIISRINYLKIRFVYEVGREQGVKSLVNEASIMSHLNDIKGSRKQYILFSRYMEALVAYHRYYNGKDN